MIIFPWHSIFIFRNYIKKANTFTLRSGYLAIHLHTLSCLRLCLMEDELASNSTLMSGVLSCKVVITRAKWPPVLPAPFGYLFPPANASVAGLPIGQKPLNQDNPSTPRISRTLLSIEVRTLSKPDSLKPCNTIAFFFILHGLIVLIAHLLYFRPYWKN